MYEIYNISHSNDLAQTGSNIKNTKTQLGYIDFSTHKILNIF